MVVGVCRIAFVVPGIHSLKQKRSLRRRLVDRTRNHFNVAIGEVGTLSVHQRLTLGFAVVSNDRSHARSMVDTIAAHLEQHAQARAVERAVELVSLRDFHSTALPEWM